MTEPQLRDVGRAPTLVQAEQSEVVRRFPVSP